MCLDPMKCGQKLAEFRALCACWALGVGAFTLLQLYAWYVWLGSQVRPPCDPSPWSWYPPLLTVFFAWLWYSCPRAIEPAPRNLQLCAMCRAEGGRHE
jgi:hypothetical protein